MSTRQLYRNAPSKERSTDGVRTNVLIDASDLQSSSQPSEEFNDVKTVNDDRADSSPDKEQLTVTKRDFNGRQHPVSHDEMVEMDLIELTEFYNPEEKVDSRLKASIKEHGLAYPILCDHEYNLIDGYKRLVACKDLGYKFIPVTFIPIDNEQNLIASLSADSKSLKWSKRLMLLDGLLTQAKIEALDRKHHKKWRGDVNSKFNADKEKLTGETFDILAEQFKCGSGRTLRKAYKVWVKMKDEIEPGQYHDLIEELDRTNSVDGVYNQHRCIQIKEECKNKDMTLPKGPFDVIVSDPPWMYPGTKKGDSYTQYCPYPTDPTEMIAEKDIKNLASKNCILFLWVTNSHIMDAFGLVAEWGFKYRRLFTWIKERPVNNRRGSLPLHQTEFVVIATKGKPTFDFKSYVDFLDTRATVDDRVNGKKRKRRRHSEKPHEFFDLVEQACAGNKVELYARAARPGWTVWGFEAPESSGKDKPKGDK